MTIMATENKIKYFENREDWRKWLTDNFETKDEIWFVFPQKSSGKKSFIYNDAVEEALCFEWIDSTIKSLDKEHKIQRFTPRNPKSTYSQANKERLKWLLENKMVHPKFEDKIRNVLSDPFVFPDDIIDRLKEDKIIWDVGHQTYVHKIITGRREKLKTIRQLDGIAGFPKIKESKTDCYETRHSSTSISVALGMAKNEKAVAVLSAGISFFVMNSTINAMLKLSGKI